VNICTETENAEQSRFCNITSSETGWCSIGIKSGMDKRDEVVYVCIYCVWEEKFVFREDKL